MAGLNLDNIDLGSFGINDDEQDQLNANMTEAVKINPQQHAKNVKLSQQSGVPEFAVESDPAQVESQLKLNQINLEGMTTRAPKTSKFLAGDANNAIIAQEDVTSGLLEGIERTFDGLGGAIKTGFETQIKGFKLQRIESSIDKFKPRTDFLSKMMGLDADTAYRLSGDYNASMSREEFIASKEEAANRLVGEIQVLQETRKALTPEDMNIVQEGVRAGIESIANMAPGIGMTLLSRGRTAPMLFSTGAQTYAGSYGEGRADGLTPEEAGWYAGIDAAIEVGTEILPTGTLEKVLTGKSTGLGKDAIKFAIREMGSEQIATALQTVNSYMFDLDKELANASSAQEMVEIQLRRQAVTAVATVVAGGAQITAATAVNKTVNKLSKSEKEATAKGSIEQNDLDKLIADAASSEMRKLDPESFKQFVREADADRDTHVFIDGPQAALFLQGKTQEEIDADTALTLLANASRESRATGTDVAIPVADFLGDIAGTDTATELRAGMTLSEDTVSPFRKEQHDIETENYVQRLFDEVDRDSSQYIEAQEIYTQVRDQLVDTGMVSSPNASVMAQVVPAWATAQAKRSGRTVAEVYESAGLTLEGPQTGEKARLEGEQILSQGNTYTPEKPEYPMAPRGEWYGDADYAARGGQVVMMNPQEYIDSVRPLTRDEETLENIEDLRNHIEEGRQLDPLAIYETGQEDGRHRALAAIDLGIEQVPVIVFGDQINKFPDAQVLADGSDLLAQAPAEDPKNLVVAHNITETGIRKANELGGLAAPSIAVANIDKGGFDNFGEISLIPKPEILNDPKIRTFDADIYSSRQPRPDEVLNSKKVKQFGEEIDASVEGTSLRTPSNSYISSAAALDQEGTQYHYLKSVGKEPKLKKTKPTAISKTLVDVSPVNQMEDPKFIGAVAKKYKAMVDKIDATESDKDFVRSIASQWFNTSLPEGYTAEFSEGEYSVVGPDGETVSSHKSERMAERRATIILKRDDIVGDVDYGSPLQTILQSELSTARNINEGVDMVKLREDISKKLNQGKTLKDYNAWLESTYDGMVDSKRMFTGYSPSGDRKYKPYTMDNIVKEMNKKLQGGESSNYGTASVRAMYANELKNVDAVKANRDEIASSEEMVEIKGEADLKFEEALEELKQYYEYDSDGWGYASDVAEAIAEGPKGIREAFGGKPAANKIINDLGKYLASLPSEYFEAKAQRPVQFSEFDTAVVPKGTSKDVIQLLKDNGVKIKMYDPKVEGSRNEVISKLSKLLFQDKPNAGGARGYYDPSNDLIRLTESADLSTFLHEFAHFMYEMEVEAGTEMNDSINNWFKRNSKDVSAEATKYLNSGYDTEIQGTRTSEFTSITEQDVVDYLDDGSTGSRDKDAAVRRATHEQFARGFETYLMEGKAPSMELRNAFRTFARWLSQIYQSVRKSLNVKLDDEMRSVFDRLLATEEQIAAAETRQRIEPMFTDAAMAGMTEEEFESYQKRISKTKDVQSETLRDKLIKAMTRKTETWWKEEKSDLVDEEMTRLQGEKVYRTSTRLRDGDIKLDHATVKEMLGEEKTDKLGRTSTRIPDKLRGMTAKGQKGVHPDEAAAFFGYNSGSEMLSDLVNAPPMKETAEVNAEAVMLERHGDPFTDGTIERLADEAVVNEERGRVILQELKTLARGTNQQTLDRQTMKSAAEDRIGELSFREIHPSKYRNAEIRAAQEAARLHAEGNREGAAQAKQRQALNYYLGMAAMNAKEETTKIVDRMARYNKKSVREEIMKAEGGYWDQITKILERFEFRKSVSMKKVDAVNQDINSWAKERMDIDGDGLVLSNAVLNESFVAHWKNVAFSDLKGINDSVKNIEHVARYANKLTRMGEEIEFNSLVERWTSSMDEVAENRFEAKRTDVVEGKKWGRWFMAQMTKIPFMASWLDGGERTGISHQVLVQPFTDAYDAEIQLWAEAGTPVMEAIQGRDKETIKRHNRKIFIPEINDNLYGHQIVAVALNVGNEGNLRKLLLGEKWADPDVDTDITLQNPKLQAVLQHMTESDWKMVQMIWDQMDTLYPKLAEVHRKTTGLVPPKVAATPVETKFGTFKGGYYPVKYDPNRSHKAAQNEDKLNAETDSMFSNSSSIQSSVNTGSTNERTGYYGAIRLSLDVVPAHFQETIHYITHHDAVREVNRLIRDKRVAETIKAKLGPEEYAQLRPWLNDIAKDGRESPQKMFWDDLLQKLRFGVTLGAMGFKASTGIIQISGLSNALAEVGTANTMQAMRSVLGSPATMKSAWDFAVENSKVMGHRAQTMDREIKNAMKRIEGKRGLLAASQEASMKHIALIQTYMVDLPTWHASYIKGMKEWGDETRAFQYADWVVENVQGSGATKDLARIMRGQSETGRMFTMFMTFFSSLWNMERDLVKGAKSGAYSVTSVAAKGMFLFTLPVLFDMLMRGEFSKEDETEEEKAQRMLTAVAMYPIQSVPFVRDVANAVTGDFGYNISPMQSIIEQGTRTIPQIVQRGFTDEEITKAQVKGATKFIGAATGVPGTAQAWASGEHLYDVIMEGEEFTMHQLLFGPERD